MIKAIVEMPKGTKAKYEIKDGVLTLDRMLYYPVPENYGYIVDTLAEDGDALDVFIISETAFHPTTVINVDIIAMLECSDNGIRDTKLIGRVVGAGDFIDYEKIAHYLNGYKPNFIVLSVSNDNKKIEQEIAIAQERYNQVRS